LAVNIAAALGKTRTDIQTRMVGVLNSVDPDYAKRVS
jgi:catalase